MLRLLVPVVLLIVAFAATEALRAPEPPADYTVCQPLDVFTLDPQRMSWNQDIRVCHSIYEGLARWDNDTFEILPAVAERWEVSDDGRTYTFHLRDGPRWSNGDPVSSRDFAYSWRRAVTPDLAADYTQQFFLIEGAEAFFQWRAEQLEAYAKRPAGERSREAALALRARMDLRFQETVAVETPDDRTLRVRLIRSTPYFLDLCCFAAFHPVHPPSVESCVNVDPDTARIEQRQDWTKPGRLVVNGPMIVARWRFKRDLRLERNPWYWNPSIVRPRSVSIVVIANPSAALLAYETGSVDWVEEVLADPLPEMIARSNRGREPDLHRVPSFGAYFWSFNCEPRLPGGQSNPFADPRVRCAFAMATSKQDLVEKVRRLGEPVAPTFIPPGTIAGYDPGRSIGGLGHDPVRARALLAEAGWRPAPDGGPPLGPDGHPFPVIDMLCSAGSFHERIAQAMGDMWERALGIRTRIVVKDGRSVGDDLQRHAYMVARGNWFGDYGDPTTFLNVHRTGDGNNDRGYSDPVFDDLMARADTAADPDARLRLLEQAERRTTEQTLPILPIFHYVRYYLYDARTLTGLSSHPRNLQYYWELGKAPCSARREAAP